MVRRVCVVCNQTCDEARRSSRSQQQLTLFLALLAHDELIDADRAKTIFLDCSRTNKGKFLCNTHYVDAVAVLIRIISELNTCAADIRERLDRFLQSGVSQATAEELISHLQHYITMIDESMVLDIRHVIRHLNEAVSRYGLTAVIEHACKRASNKRKMEDVAETVALEVKHRRLCEGAQEVPPVTDENAAGSQSATQPLSQLSARSAFSSVSAALSSGSMRSVSDYVPERDTSGSSSSESFTATRRQTDTDKWNQNFIVDGLQLKQLFRFCPYCGSPLANDGSPLELRVVGSTPIVNIDCDLCRKAPGRAVVWTGQRKAVDHPRSRAFAGNTTAGIAAVTTGTRWSVLSRLAKEMNLAFISRSSFYRIFEDLRPAITRVYDLHRADVIDIIRSAYWQDGSYDGWDIAVDGAYDSRGFSAAFCKVLAVDLKTKLCIHTEVVHSSETGGISGRMEKEGFRRLLLWFAELGLPIRSVTSDRHAHFKNVIDELNATLSWNMEWYYDHWHLGRYLVKALREASKKRSFTLLKNWIRSLKAHLKCAAEAGLQTGDNNNIKFFFNTCLYHIAGIHTWDQDELTGPYTSCSHEVMEGDHPEPIPVGNPAHEKLKEIVLERRFQSDLCRLGPYGGTSQCETKNALDRLYCPKEVYFPPSSYPAYVAMSTLHLNTLRLAEMAGDRVVERRYPHHRKFNDHPINMVHKTNVDHRWRREIRDEYLRDRLFDLEQSQTEDDGFGLDEDQDVSNVKGQVGHMEGYSDNDTDDEDIDLPSEEF